MWGICPMTGIRWRSYWISNTDQLWNRRQHLLTREWQLAWDCLLVLHMNLNTCEFEDCFTAQWREAGPSMEKVKVLCKRWLVAGFSTCETTSFSSCVPRLGSLLTQGFWSSEHDRRCPFSLLCRRKVTQERRFYRVERGLYSAGLFVWLTF